MAKAGRIAKTAEIAAEPSVDNNKIDGAIGALRDQAQKDQLELLELAGDVGALRALEMTRSLVAAATIRIFQKVCESKKIKDLPIQMTDGSVATATDLDDFCKLAFGRPRSAMFEASASLEALGDEAYEAASRLGLNRSALRAARALPPEKLETVRLAISNGSSKAEVLSVIEDLAEKVETTEKQVADLKAEKEASEQLMEAKNKTIDKLQREVKRFEKLPPDEKLLALQKDVADAMNDARGAVLGRMRQAVIALVNFGDDRHAHDVFLAGLVGQVQAELAQLRQEFDLPDVSTAAEATLAAEVAQWAGKN